MHVPSVAIVGSLALAVALSARNAGAENERDFVFTDIEGHLVMRFAGTDSANLSPQQLQDVANVELSTMVHERLSVDAVFDAEPVDSRWADPMERRVERHMTELAPEFSGVAVECRSASCRVVLEHAGGWNVTAHRTLMGTAQRAIEAFIADEPDSFAREFFVVGRYQEPRAPYITMLLRRAERRSPSGRAGARPAPRVQSPSGESA